MFNFENENEIEIEVENDSYLILSKNPTGDYRGMSAGQEVDWMRWGLDEMGMDEIGWGRWGDGDGSGLDGSLNYRSVRA